MPKQYDECPMVSHTFSECSMVSHTFFERLKQFKNSLTSVTNVQGSIWLVLVSIPPSETRNDSISLQTKCKN